VLLFGMCAISERPAGAGPIDRNGQRRWLLKAREAAAIIVVLCLHPHLLRRTHRKRGDVPVPMPGMPGCATRRELLYLE
jgi:integrase